MSTAKLSKTYVRFVKPNNLPDLLSEGFADHANLSAPNDEAMLPGTLVCRNQTNGTLVRAHDGLVGPVEIVWTDGTNRADAQRIEINGSTVTRYTTVLPSNVVADVSSELFTAAPVAGDAYIVKAPSGTVAAHGKLVPLTPAEVDSLTTEKPGSANHVVVGRIIQLISRTWDCGSFLRVAFN